MAVKLPKDLKQKIHEAIYHRADEFGYAFRGRRENSGFMTSLISDPEIGGKLSDYMPKGNIRTYIKDAVLNKYTKEIIHKSLTDLSSTSIVSKVYAEEAVELTSKANLHICANKDSIFIICDGTVAKWESALRKALETASNLPNEDNKQIRICIKLASLGPSPSRGDKTLITRGLSFINAQVYFCS